VKTPFAEKCDVEHICFHSVRLLRDPSFGYPEHSNWQQGFGSVLISPALLTPPNKQTNKQTNDSIVQSASARSSTADHLLGFERVVVLGAVWQGENLEACAAGFDLTGVRTSRFFES
jgi:hypothetical protein